MSIVLESGCVLERIFRGIERQVSFVVLFLSFNGAKAHRDIFLAGSKEAADAHDRRVNRQ